MASIQLEIQESKLKLKTEDRDAFFKKEFAKLQLKVVSSWFEIVTLFLATFLGVLKTSLILGLNLTILPIILALIAAILITFLFSSFRNYQLKITRFDKEHIYKKISKELIEKSKS